MADVRLAGRHVRDVCLGENTCLVGFYMGFYSQQGIVLQHPPVRHDIPGSLAMSVSQHVSATPSAIALMLGTTYSSINPAGYQTNQEVQEPGNYAFTDFVKLGVPLPLLLD